MHARNAYPLKRALDLAGALGGLVLLAPLWGLVALAVFLDGPGGVIYRQWRVGQYGRWFRMLKFRTLTEGPAPRLTPLGAFLRRSALNELPQLVNVLRGEMSLVGPRPELPSLAARWRRELPGYPRRHLLRPGMAGLAQVRLGAAAPEKEKLGLDLDYIEQASPGLDLALIAAAVLKACRGGCDAQDARASVRTPTAAPGPLQIDDAARHFG